MKSLGFPCPVPDFVVGAGTDFGFVAAKIWSRKRYAAASTTPRARIRTSEDEAIAIANDTENQSEKRRTKGPPRIWGVEERYGERTEGGLGYYNPLARRGRLCQRICVFRSVAARSKFGSLVVSASVSYKLQSVICHIYHHKYLVSSAHNPAEFGRDKAPQQVPMPTLGNVK